jgi:Zn-dependent peptidase ImmA (M78 family)/DNA-binding XRE family transcriptional regulator
MIYGARIKQAREYCGLTQKELANRVGVNQSFIAHLENDRTDINPNLLVSLAEQTGFASAFFFIKPFNNFPVGTLALRARNSFTSRDLNQAYQYANLLFEYVIKLTEKFNIPQVSVPITENEPNRAATIVRKNFGLSDDTPIRNLTVLVEKKGVIFLALPIVLNKIDAFSTWANNSMPVIAVFSGKPTDRMRFSVAHELGHLVMHHESRKRIIEMESEANKFAAELLLPEKAMKHEIRLPVTLISLARLKPRWGVSIQAIIRRARDLDIITDRQYRYLFEQLSKRGWRLNEPTNLDIPREKPRMIKKMIEQSYDSSNFIQLIAKDLNLSEEKAIALLGEYFDKEKMPFIKYNPNLKNIEKYKQN